MARPPAVIINGLSVPAQGWGGVGALSMLGTPPAPLSSPVQPSLGAMAATTSPAADADGGKPWHPDNPLFWFGVLLATTFGLIGAATSIRVGPFKAAVGAGNP